MRARINERLDTRPGTTPNPDPTERTKEDLQREIAGLKEFYDARFVAWEKAIVLLQSNADKAPSPAVIEERILSLRALHDERFRGIAVQFEERDTRTEQTFSQSQIALNAALSTAKEAVEKQNASSALAIAKSEAATAEQLKQMTVTFGETNKGTSDKIDDIKERITTIESRGAGKNDTWGTIGAVIGVAGLLMGVIIAFMAYIK